MWKYYNLNRKVSWHAWQFGIFKLCVGCLGIIIGAYFADFFRNYYWLLWLIFIITWIPLMQWWFQPNEAD